MDCLSICDIISLLLDSCRFFELLNIVTCDCFFSRVAEVVKAVLKGTFDCVLFLRLNSAALIYGYIRLSRGEDPLMLTSDCFLLPRLLLSNADSNCFRVR